MWELFQLHRHYWYVITSVRVWTVPYIYLIKSLKCYLYYLIFSLCKKKLFSAEIVKNNQLLIHILSNRRAKYTILSAICLHYRLQLSIVQLITLFCIVNLKLEIFIFSEYINYFLQFLHLKESLEPWLER